MPQPRHRLVNLEATPFYHVMSRCVRQQFLCGIDRQTGRDFSYRKEWIRERVHKVASAFALHIYAYAIMSNHFHLIVAIDQEAARKWTNLEVARRWRMIFKGPPILQRYICGESLSSKDAYEINRLIDRYRDQLCDLSWFMRAVNEPIARMANNEDNVSGHFWQGRFKSQALLTEGALLSAMAYVDLNPIRAGLAETPETSAFTSIEERIKTFSKSGGANSHQRMQPILGPRKRAMSRGLDHYKLQEYLELVDWSGRALAKNKPGAIPQNLPRILARLAIHSDGYLSYIRREERGFYNVIGPYQSIQKTAQILGRGFLRGQKAAKRVFSEAFA